jgi:hypothetical protein
MLLFATLFLPLQVRAAENEDREIARDVEITELKRKLDVVVTELETLRTQAELLKLAIFVGQIAVGKWDPWDKLEFPSASVLKRLRIDSLAKIIEDTRTDTLQIISHQKLNAAAEGKTARAQNTEDTNASREKPETAGYQIDKQLAYCNLSSATFDFLQKIVSSMGIGLTECQPDAVETNQNLLINCLWTPPQLFKASFPPGKPCGEKLILTDANHVVFYRSAGKVVTLPTSYGTFHNACRELAQVVESSPREAAVG